MLGLTIEVPDLAMPSAPLLLLLELRDMVVICGCCVGVLVVLF